MGDISIIHVPVLLVSRVVVSVVIKEGLIHLKHDLLAPHEVVALPEHVGAVELVKHVAQERRVSEGSLLEGRLDVVEVTVVSLGVAVCG